LAIGKEMGAGWGVAFELVFVTVFFCDFALILTYFGKENPLERKEINVP